MVSSATSVLRFAYSAAKSITRYAPLLAAWTPL